MIGAPSALAQEEPLRKTAAVLADSYRIMTNSDIALVSDASVRAAILADAADTRTEARLCQKADGAGRFDLISTKITEGGNSYPFSRSARGNKDGVRRRRCSQRAWKGLYVAQTPIDFEAKYTVALSGDYAAAYEAVETEAAYQPDNSLLGSYLLSFGEAADESESAVTQEPDSASAPNQNDGIAILHNQTTILSSALVLVAIALAIYLIIWRKKKKDDKTIQVCENFNLICKRGYAIIYASQRLALGKLLSGAALFLLRRNTILRVRARIYAIIKMLKMCKLR